VGEEAVVLAGFVLICSPHNAAVMAVPSLIFGFKLVGDGIAVLY
jgi:hypothetical protein